MAYRRNPFEDEDEDRFEDLSDTPELARLKQERELYQQRMIDSSYRSLGLIHESQDIASETGTELRKQREQLERTNKNLDKISGDLQQSDRNITSLKSIWGTFSTWLKKPLKPTQGEQTGSKDDFTEVASSIERDNNSIKTNLNNVSRKTNLSWEDGNNVSPFSRNPGTADAIVDKNLEQMLAGLEALKHQGMSLGKEIDEQNELLETIQGKVSTADVKIGEQTTRINKILK